MIDQQPDRLHRQGQSLIAYDVVGVPPPPPKWSAPKAPLSDWSDEDVDQAIRMGRLRLDVEWKADLMVMRAALDHPDPMESMLAAEQHQKRVDNLHKGLRLLEDEQKRRAAIPKPIDRFPFDDSTEKSWLLYHTAHGWMTGYYVRGTWSEHHEYGREYEGPVFVLGDDLHQVEVEEWPTDEGVVEYYCGPITHFLPAVPEPAKPEEATA